MADFESDGYLVTDTKTTDGAAIKLVTQATIPQNTSIDVTVYQDTTGDGNADNSEQVSIGDGSDRIYFTNFADETGSDYWLRIDLTTSDGTTTPEFDSATLTVLQNPRFASSYITQIETDSEGTGVIATANSETYSPQIDTDSSGSLVVRANSYASTLETDATPKVHSQVYIPRIDTDIDHIISLGRSTESYATQIDTDSGIEVSSDSYSAQADTDVIRESISVTRTIDSYLQTLDTDASATTTDWVIDESLFREIIEEVREWDSIELTFRMPQSIVEDAVRGLEDGAGKLQVVPQSTGGFKVVDMEGTNTVVILSPTDRHDVRSVDTWVLESIDEEVVGKSGDYYDVTVEAVPEREKAFDNSYGTLSPPFPSYTRQSGQWLFRFAAGDIVTKRVSTGISRAPDSSLQEIELQLALTPEQVRIVEESLSYLNQNNIREVPDGRNLIEDTSSDKRNTVDITPPTDARDTVNEGRFVAKDWVTEWAYSGAYIVTLTAVPIDLTFAASGYGSGSGVGSLTVQEQAASQPGVIEDWEVRDVSDYSGDTGFASLTSTASSGNNAVQITGGAGSPYPFGNDMSMIYIGSQVIDTPQPGDTFTFDARLDTAEEAHVIFGWEQEDIYWGCLISSVDVLVLYYSDGSNSDSSVSSASISSGQWYTIEVDWASSGTGATATLQGQGALVSLSGGPSSGNGFGWAAEGQSSENALLDNARFQ